MEEAFNGREAWPSVLGVDGTVWNPYCGGGYINLYGNSQNIYSLKSL